MRLAHTRRARQCSLLWSFIDTYFIASLALLTLLPSNDASGAAKPSLLTLSQLVSRAQKIGEQLFFQCCVDLFEAISKEQLQNAFKLYRHWSIFSLTSTDAVRDIVSLTPEFSTESQLLVLVHRVAQYKKKARSYRSRRFKSLGDNSDEVADAIAIAYSCVDDTPPAERKTELSGRRAPREPSGSEV